ncbi:RNA polymerase sigma factor [Paenibacillus sp. M1]|uniref:RNA polymerase sigma factor n=1 Tax=Paenibacillus haidiansis TaxID=1574488 RepID=A0ABU7VUC2_9BACL
MNDREMFEAHKEQIFRLCYCMMQDRSDAEDICQEVFVKAILADRSQIRDLRPWLLKIASNECRKVLKRRKSGLAKEKFAYLLAPPQHGNPVEEGYDRKEKEDEVNIWLNRLPEKVRVVVVLRFVNELTLREIAEVIQVPEGTVKSRLNKGTKLLRRWIDPDIELKPPVKERKGKWTEFLRVK